MKLIPHLLACVLGWMLALPSAALRLDLLPVPATISLPGSTTLSVVLSGLDADQQILSSYDIFLTYDPAIVDATAAVFGPSLGGPLDSFSSADLSIAGHIELVEASFLSDSDLFALQGDTVMLATLMFSGLNLGTSSIQFNSFLLTGKEDPQDPGFVTVLDPEVGGTRIIVQQGTAPEPPLWLLLLAALGAAILGTRARRGARVTPTGLV